MKVKNNKQDSDVWCGQTINSQQYYTIQSSELFKWQNDSKVLADIGSGDLILNDETEDILDVSLAINTLKLIDTNPKDVDGSKITRVKAAKQGWTFFLLPIEFTTSKLSSIYSKKYDQTNRSGLTYKIYDSNNQEITDAQNELNAVKTVVDFEPTHDYEVIGGQLQQHTKPITDIRIWVVGVPDVPENMGGSKEMIGGVNLRFIDPTDKVNADGRASKYMTYDATYHTNKLRLIITHNAGVQHDLLMIIEMFKA